MNKRAKRIVLEATIGLLLGTVLLSAAGVYILSRGPLSISALTPILEDALNVEGSPYRVKVENTQIIWGGWDRAVDVIATNVTVVEADKAPLAVLPQVSVEVSFSALLSGDIRVRKLDLIRPSLKLDRHPDGQLVLSMDGLDGDSADDGSKPGTQIALPQKASNTLIPEPILNALTGKTQPQTFLAGLQSFSIIDAEIQIRDHAIAESLMLHNANLGVSRSPAGLLATLYGTLETPTENTDISGSVSVFRDTERIETKLNFGPLDTNLPIRYLPDLVFYLPDMTSSGQLGVDFNFQGQPIRATSRLNSAAGSIELDATPNGALPAATLNATFDAFDAAVWLGGLYDVENVVAYMPRVPISGTATTQLNDQGLPRDITAELTSRIGDISLTAQPSEETGGLTGSILFTGLDADTISQTAPKLGLLDGVTVRVDGSADFALDPQMKPLSGRVDINFGSGQLPGIPDVMETVPDLLWGRLAARLSPDDNVITLENLTLDFSNPEENISGPSISLTGSARPAETGMDIDLNGLVLDLPMNRLPAFWPETLAPNPREWVTDNIPEADVHQAGIAASLSIPDMDPQQITINSLSGGIEFDQAQVHYLRPLPPATGVAGLAEFTDTSFDIDITAGVLKDAKLTDGKILISGLDGDNEAIDIGLSIATPLSTALQLLDTSPRNYISRIGLNPAGITGNAVADVRFRFPLLADLNADDIVYETDAVLRKISVPRPELDAVVTAESVALGLRPGKLVLEGDVRIDTTPARVIWNENFADEGDQQTQLAITTTADLSELRRFNLPLAGIAEGPASLSATYTTFKSGSQTIDLAADLTHSTLMVDMVDWRKEPGTPSSLALKIGIDPTNGYRIDNIVLDGGQDHRLVGQMQANADFKRITNATIETLRYGNTNISGTVKDVNGIYQVTLNGPSMDITPFVDLDETDTTDRDAPPVLEPAIQISGSVESVFLSADRSVDNVDFRLDLQGEQVDRLNVLGSLGADKSVNIQYLPTPNGGHSLDVTADDTGLALAIADITGRLEGGKLTITGLRQTADDPMLGRIEMRNFKLLDAPRLTKILEVISVTGILAALNNEGLAFDTMTVDFSLTPDSFDILDGVARGNAMGVTATGAINRTEDTLNIGGDIAVAGIFSNTIGAIPGINLLLGDGLFGVTYRMTGPVDDPDVNVNPLSVIAPGFLRKALLFCVCQAPHCRINFSHDHAKSH